MANKRKLTEKQDQNTLVVEHQSAEDQAQTLAKIADSPALHGVLMVQAYTQSFGVMSS